jgi:hypothetical protein
MQNIYVLPLDRQRSSSDAVTVPVPRTTGSDITYYVLPTTTVAPNPSTIHPLNDLILPPSSAFGSPSSSISTYPSFLHNSSWSTILSLVQNPRLLWDIYAPKNLGEYICVKEIWDTWDAGLVVQNVGQMPPLKDVEERFGKITDPKTGRTCFPRWRARLDLTVSTSSSPFADR